MCAHVRTRAYLEMECQQPLHASGRGGILKPRFCPDPDTCKQNCAVEGVDAKGYKKNYGVHQMLPSSLRMHLAIHNSMLL